MASLKTEFIKYLSDNYLNRINTDINSKLKELHEDGLLIRTEIADLSALDSDDAEFVFKIKAKSELMKLDGSPKLYTFSVEYSCDLDDGIKNLTTIGIDVLGKGRFTYTESLTECFIPLNKKDRYEKLAIRFLKKYLKNEYKVYPLQVGNLLTEVGVKPFFSYNFKDSLGKTVFSDCDIKLKPEAEPVRLSKGSIIINVKNLLMTGNNKLARTTIVHECLHWHYHRKAFEIIMLLNKEYKYFDCKEYVSNGDPINEALSWMESQAYAVTKACMLLEENVKDILAAAFSVTNYGGIEPIDYYYSVVSKMSDDFGTTISDTVKRISSLGYSEVDSLKNDFYDSVIDSVYQKEKLKDDQTRRINRRIYEFMLENSPNLQIAINSGLYVYADGFVVIKSSKYLIRIGDHYLLNSYARTHIEECSLIFNVKKDYRSSFNPANAMALITANSGATNKTILVGDTDRFVITEFMLDSIMSQEPEIRDTILKKAYFGDDGMSFGDYFDHLIDKNGYTSVNDLINDTHCSRSVIENYRDDEDASYSAEKVLAICAGMKLLPPESKHLIKKSGVIDLDSSSKKSKVYNHLVNDLWDSGIEKWNSVLRKSRLPLLYNDEK